MSEILRFSLPSDVRARIATILPRVTEADFAWLDRIVAADGLLREDGSPHPAFVRWVQGILDRGYGAEGAMAVVPVRPSPAPAGALIGGGV